MAKMFYTLDETKAALGMSEDEIKQLSRDGRLREFRDGPRLMFRADQVDALKGSIAGGLGGDMGVSDSGSPIGLADSHGSSIGLSLADSGAGASASTGSGLAALPGSGMIGSGLGSGLGSGIAGSGLGSGLAGAGSGMMNLKDDTSLSADLNLAGSSAGGTGAGMTGSGLASSGRGSGTGSGAGSGGASGSRGGVNVLGEEEGGFDPMAQTAISSAPMADLNLESVGSGSGLLDLTRESDDTSLGAELLDEISPAGAAAGGAPRRAATPPDSGAAVTAVGRSGVGLEAPSGGVVRGTVGVTYQEAADPVAGAFGGAALGAALVLLFGIFALVSSAFGAPAPDSLQWFANKSFFITAGILLIPPAIGFIGGFLVGR